MNDLNHKGVDFSTPSLDIQITEDRLSSLKSVHGIELWKWMNQVYNESGTTRFNLISIYMIAKGMKLSDGKIEEVLRELSISGFIGIGQKLEYKDFVGQEIQILFTCPLQEFHPEVP